MIQPNHVHMRQQRAQTVYAPPVSSPPRSVPVVNRVTPELSQGAEVIGRHASDKTWPVLVVEQEELRVGPHVTRIGGNEGWQVANQAHPLGTGVFSETLPLAAQEELRNAGLLDLVRERTPR